MNGPLAFRGFTVDQNFRVLSVVLDWELPSWLAMAQQTITGLDWPGTVPVVLSLMANGMLERNVELLCGWARPLVLAWGAGLALRGTGTVCWGSARQESRAPAASWTSIS